MIGNEAATRRFSSSESADSTFTIRPRPSLFTFFYNCRSDKNLVVPSPSRLSSKEKEKKTKAPPICPQCARDHILLTIPRASLLCRIKTSIVRLHELSSGKEWRKVGLCMAPIALCFRLLGGQMLQKRSGNVQERLFEWVLVRTGRRAAM